MVLPNESPRSSSDTDASRSDSDASNSGSDIGLDHVAPPLRTEVSCFVGAIFTLVNTHKTGQKSAWLPDVKKHPSIDNVPILAPLNGKAGEGGISVPGQGALTVFPHGFNLARAEWNQTSEDLSPLTQRNKKDKPRKIPDPTEWDYGTWGFRVDTSGAPYIDIHHWMMWRRCIILFYRLLADENLWKGKGKSIWGDGTKWLPLGDFVEEYNRGVKEIWDYSRDKLPEREDTIRRNTKFYQLKLHNFGQDSKKSQWEPFIQIYPPPKLVPSTTILYQVDAYQFTDIGYFARWTDIWRDMVVSGTKQSLEGVVVGSQEQLKLLADEMPDDCPPYDWSQCFRNSYYQAMCKAALRAVEDKVAKSPLINEALRRKIVGVLVVFMVSMAIIPDAKGGLDNSWSQLCITPPGSMTSGWPQKFVTPLVNSDLNRQLLEITLPLRQVTHLKENGGLDDNSPYVLERLVLGPEPPPERTLINKEITALTDSIVEEAIKEMMKHSSTMGPNVVIDNLRRIRIASGDLNISGFEMVFRPTMMGSSDHCWWPHDPKAVCQQGETFCHLTFRSNYSYNRLNWGFNPLSDPGDFAGAFVSLLRMLPDDEFEKALEKLEMHQNVVGSKQDREDHAKYVEERRKLRNEDAGVQVDKFGFISLPSQEKEKEKKKSKSKSKKT